MFEDMIFSGEEIAPGIFIFDDAFTNCEEIINRSKEIPQNRIAPAMLQDGSVRTETRNNTLMDLSPTFDMDVFWWSVAQRLWQFGVAYATFYKTDFSGMESPQLLQYERGEGFYKPHSDSAPNFPRVFSAVLYLNDVEVGGETYFTRFNVSVSAKAGRLAIFPANFIYEHEARVPISDPKNVIVTWYTPLG